MVGTTLTDQANSSRVRLGGNSLRVLPDDMVRRYNGGRPDDHEYCRWSLGRNAASNTHLSMNSTAD
jgi:hypothetical protein